MSKIVININKQLFYECDEHELSTPLEGLCDIPFIEKVVAPTLDILSLLLDNITFGRLYNHIANNIMNLGDEYKITQEEFWELLQENREDSEDIIKTLDGDFHELISALDEGNAQKFFSHTSSCARVAQVARMFFQFKDLHKVLVPLFCFLGLDSNDTHDKQEMPLQTNLVAGRTEMGFMDESADIVHYSKELPDDEQFRALIGYMVRMILYTSFALLEKNRSLFPRKLIYRLEDIIELKHISDEKEKEDFRGIIDYFKDQYETKQEINKENDYSELIKKWNSHCKELKPQTFCLAPMLNDDQTGSLISQLECRGYITAGTTIPACEHILGGKKCNDYKPIIWIKKTSKGHPSKVSVLNFLRLLGVSWDDISINRLNYCFICPQDKYTFSPFRYNNIKNKRGVKAATSEYDEELKDIIRKAIGDGHVICQRWKKLIWDE